MAQTYYIDSSDFATATSIWLDEERSVQAPDGYYQIGGVYREMRGAELLPVATCPSCTDPSLPITIEWFFGHNPNAAIDASILYTNIDGQPDGVFVSLTNQTIDEFQEGTITNAMPGTLVSVNVSNFSFDQFSTPLTVLKDGVPIYSEANIGMSGNSFDFITEESFSYRVSGSAVGNEVSGGGELQP